MLIRGRLAKPAALAVRGEGKPNFVTSVKQI
jgi:hypothetical protein